MIKIKKKKKKTKPILNRDKFNNLKLRLIKEKNEFSLLNDDSKYNLQKIIDNVWYVNFNIWTNLGTLFVDKQTVKTKFIFENFPFQPPKIFILNENNLSKIVNSLEENYSPAEKIKDLCDKLLKWIENNESYMTPFSSQDKLQIDNNSFKELFKDQFNKWKCNTCYVFNEQNLSNCVCCGSIRLTTNYISSLNNISDDIINKNYNLIETNDNYINNFKY